MSRVALASPMSPDNLLLVADSKRSADMLYAVGMFVPDPVIYLRVRGQAYAVMDEPPTDRAGQKPRQCRVLSLRDCQTSSPPPGRKSPSMAEVISSLLKKRRLRTVTVPNDFPVGLAKDLEKLRISVRVKKGPAFPERATKGAEEIKKISAALTMAEVGLAEGIQALRTAKITKHSRLLYHNVLLTAEKLRSIMDTAIVQAGGLSHRTIVAGGRQACDPRELGHGLLRAHEPIILDVLPRSQKTGYFGAITRTVVKGRASEPIRRLFHTVEHAQEMAFNHLSNQALCHRIHLSIESFFEQNGYPTTRSAGQPQGFFHPTGHGLGLDIDEPPRLDSLSRDILRPGHVLTVQPGLYYSQLGGGVRLNDVALIGRNGPRNLTRFEKILEI